MIQKIIQLLAILTISGCTPNSNEFIDAYTYFIDMSTCKQPIQYCPIKPTSEVIFTIDKKTSMVTYRDIALNNPNNKTYGKLINCTIFDYENFRCDGLELVNGKFHLNMAFSIDSQGRIVKNNDNYFSNYLAISSSKSLYYISSVKPVVKLSLFNKF